MMPGLAGFRDSRRSAGLLQGAGDRSVRWPGTASGRRAVLRAYIMHVNVHFFVIMQIKRFYVTSLLVLFAFLYAIWHKDWSFLRYVVEHGRNKSDFTFSS